MSRIKQIIDSYMSHLYPQNVSEDFAEWLEHPADKEAKRQAMQEYWEAIDAPMDRQKIDTAYCSTKERISRRNFGRRRLSIFARVARAAAIIALPIAAAAIPVALSMIPIKRPPCIRPLRFVCFVGSSLSPTLAFPQLMLCVFMPHSCTKALFKYRLSM